MLSWATHFTWFRSKMATHRTSNSPLEVADQPGVTMVTSLSRSYVGETTHSELYGLAPTSSNRSALRKLTSTVRNQPQTKPHSCETCLAGTPRNLNLHLGTAKVYSDE